MGAPDILPADFDKWDAKPTGAPPTGAPPDTLPANFDKWDNQTSAKPRTWLDSATDFASEMLKQINPISGIKGAAQLAAHPIESYKADTTNREQIMQKAEEAFKKGDYGGGMSHALYAIIPFLGSQLNEAGEQFQRGEYAKGAGASTGIGLNLAGPGALKGSKLKVPTGSFPERMYQSALKPPPGSYSTSEVGNMVKTGLENKIPVSASGLQKLSGLVDDLNSKVKAEIQTGNQQGATINKFDVTRRLSDTAKKFETQVNPEADLQAISESGNEFIRNQPGQISVADAQALKQGTYRQLKSKSFGELKSATIESQKALARGIKEELQNQFPEIGGLNAKEAQLIGLDGALERAVRRIDNHQLLGIGTPLAVGAGGVLTGSPVGAAASGVLKLVLDNPEFKSKLAIALNKAGKGSIPFPTAMARVAGYSNALGKAANQNMPSDNQAQQAP